MVVCSMNTYTIRKFHISKVVLDKCLDQDLSQNLRNMITLREPFSVNSINAIQLYMLSFLGCSFFFLKMMFQLLFLL